jgi:hypothetical protein
MSVAGPVIAGPRKENAHIGATYEPLTAMECPESYIAIIYSSIYAEGIHTRFHMIGLWIWKYMYISHMGDDIDNSIHGKSNQHIIIHKRPY